MDTILSTTRLDRLTTKLTSECEKSSWAGKDKALKLSPAASHKLDKKIIKMWPLRETKSKKCLEQALKLFNEGHRSEFVCRCVAAGYRYQG